MNRSSKDYEREADQARESLAGTLDALRERLQPSNMVDDVKEYARTHVVEPVKTYARDTARSYANSPSLPLAAGVAVAARSYPLPAILIGAGAWLLMRNWRAEGSNALADDDERLYANPAYRKAGRRVAEAGEDLESAAGDAAHAVRERAERLAGTVRDRAGALREGVDETFDDVVGRAGAAAGSLKDAASRRYHDARDTAYDYAGAVADRASELGDRAAERFDHARERAMEAAEEASLRAARARRRATREVKRVAQEQPLVLAAIGLAIGAALGAAFPATRSERALMGEAARSTRRQAEAAARDGYRRARRAAEGLADDAREELHRQKLDQDGLAEAAGEVTTRVRTAAKNVGRNAKRRLTEATDGTPVQQAAAAATEGQQQAGGSTSGSATRQMGS